MNKKLTALLQGIVGGVVVIVLALLVVLAILVILVFITEAWTEVFG